MRRRMESEPLGSFERWVLYNVLVVLVVFATILWVVLCAILRAML